MINFLLVNNPIYQLLNKKNISWKLKNVYTNQLLFALICFYVECLFNHVNLRFL